MGSSAYDLQPKDVWWYTAMLLVSTVLATVISWWFLKWKGLLPKKVD
jgi:hypothetical protein